jgi:hypothetical protein
MELYCLFLGVILEILAISILLSRLIFASNARPAIGTVVAKVLRNNSPETPTGKVKHLKIEYNNLHNKTSIHVCDSSVITMLYTIGEKVKLSISNDRVLINSTSYIFSAPLFISLFGAALLNIYFKFL